MIVRGAPLFPFLGRGFLPEFQEGTLTVSAVTVSGTGIVESDELGRLVERKMLGHHAVVSTARRTGRAELDEHAQGVNAAEIDVVLISDLSQAELGDVMDQLRVDLTAVAGTNITMGQPIGHRIDHMLSGTRAAIAIKIFGPDLYELRRIAEAVDVAFYGEAVSQVLEGQNAFDLVVRFDEEHRGSAEKIRNALIDTPLGAKIELAMARRGCGGAWAQHGQPGEPPEKDRGPIERQRP